MSLPAQIAGAALDAAKLLLSLAGTEEEARRLLSAAAVERGRLAADVLEVALYDEPGRPR